MDYGELERLRWSAAFAYVEASPARFARRRRCLIPANQHCPQRNYAPEFTFFKLHCHQWNHAGEDPRSGIQLMNFRVTPMYGKNHGMSIKTLRMCERVHFGHHLVWPRYGQYYNGSRTKISFARNWNILSSHYIALRPRSSWEWFRRQTMVPANMFKATFEKNIVIWCTVLITKRVDNEEDRHFLVQV